MKNKLFLSLFASLTLGAIGCTGGSTGTYVNALTGERCEPNPATLMPKENHGQGHGQNPQCQGTSNGDNCDDLHSGKIDCIGDGNSGQGDDKKHECEFPQPGCDDEGCCDPEVVVPPPGEPGGDDGDEHECDAGTPDPGDGSGDPVPVPVVN